MEGEVRINSNKREKTSTKHTLLLLNIYSVIIHKTMYIHLTQQTGLYIYIYFLSVHRLFHIHTNGKQLLLLILFLCTLKLVLDFNNYKST